MLSFFFVCLFIQYLVQASPFFLSLSVYLFNIWLVQASHFFFSLFVCLFIQDLVEAPPFFFVCLYIYLFNTYYLHWLVRAPFPRFVPTPYWLIFSYTLPFFFSPDIIILYVIFSASSLAILLPPPPPPHPVPTPNPPLSHLPLVTLTHTTPLPVLFTWSVSSLPCPSRRCRWLCRPSALSPSPAPSLFPSPVPCGVCSLPWPARAGRSCRCVPPASSRAWPEQRGYRASGRKS